MNKVIMMGRLTRDPELSVSSNGTSVARYSIAVDRRFKKEGGPTADFFNCTSFGKQADFVGKYLLKGTKVVLDGEMQNNNYTNKEGQTVYGMQILVNNIEFAESKNASGNNAAAQTQEPPQPSGDIGDGFMNIPEGIEAELPFN